MKVRDLKKLLEGVDDDMDVLMPMTNEFDGFFKSPCEAETGVAELGKDEETDETEPAFVIAPHGFFEEHEGVPVELN